MTNRIACFLAIALLLSFLPALAIPSHAASAVGSCDSTTRTCLFAPVADAYVTSATPTQNFGSSSTLEVESTTQLGNTTPVAVSYLRFDLQAIPHGQGVVKAVLSLFLTSRTGTSTASVGIHQSTNTTWGELTVNWNNAPSYGSSSVGVNNSIGAQSRTYTWDVTSAFRNSSLVTTLVAVGISANITLGFASRETSHSPVLTVEYGVVDTLPPVIRSLRIQPVSPSSEQLVTVLANVTDDTVVSAALLSYSVNGTFAAQLAMSPSGGGMFSGTIQRQSSGSLVNVTVTAVDPAGLSATSSLAFTVVRPSYYFALLNQYNLLTSQYGSLAAQYDSLLATLKNLTVSLPSVQSWNAFKASYSNLQSQYGDLQSAYNGLQTNYLQAEQKISNLTSQLGALSTMYAQASTQLQGSLSRISSLYLTILGLGVIMGSIVIALSYLLLVRPRLMSRQAHGNNK